MQTAAFISDADLLARMPHLVRAERGAMLEVILHLLEIDCRRLYLEQACSSLYSYCKERLSYSEDEALKRVRVTRLARRLPQVLEELKTGGIHLTGLFVLSQHLTEENAEALLREARGKSRREIEQLVARWFPQPDVADRIEATSPGLLFGPATCSGTGRCSPTLSAQERPKLEPLSPVGDSPGSSATRYRVEFTASAERARSKARAS